MSKDRAPTHAEIYEHFQRAYSPARLKFRPATDSWDYEGKPITSNELARMVAFELEHSHHKVQNVIVKAAYDNREAAWTQMRTWLDHVESRPRDDSELRKWLRAMERPDTDAMMHEANVVAMKQWLWQVKRGIMQLHVVWHVAPIFWSGENGTGKSFNVQRLFAPVETFARNLNVNDLGEKFSGRLMAQTLVAFLDEFAGTEKTEAAQLKAILTGKDIDARSMHSESGFHATNRMSCIATSNVPPPHGFIDTTGARRFWSIHCSGETMTKGSTRMAQFDAIDYDAIWSAIGVKDQSPQYTTPSEILNFMAAIREQRLRTKTSLEHFASECLESAPGDKLTLKEVQTAYKNYCQHTRHNTVRASYRGLSELLNSLGFRVVCRSNRWYLKDQAIVDFEKTTD